MRSKVDYTASKNFGWREKGVTTVALSNNFSSDCIFLGIECKRSKGSSKKLGIRSGVQVEARRALKELNIFQFEGHRVLG